MVLRANTLLAADLALDSSFPIALPYLEEARRLGLETAQTLSFRSMLVVGEPSRAIYCGYLKHQCDRDATQSVLHPCLVPPGDIDDDIPF